MSVQVKNITKYYDKQKALNDVSFEISKGEIVGFLGPNGAGKSTMMKIICSYLSSSSGSVIICGQELINNDSDIKKLIGYLPEHNPLYLDMYVKEFLEFVCGVHGIKNKKDRIKEVISLTGLEKEQNKKIGALSKGYRQRVGISQAIIHDPEVLILDEPTTGLDPNQIVEIRDLIKKIGEKKTVMLSTHIMQEVEAICTRAIIINNGEVVADKDILSLKNLSEEQVLEVEFQSAFDVGILNSLEGVSNVLPISDKRFSITNTNLDLKQVVSRLALDHDNIIVTLNSKAISLEEVFQNLTK